MIAGVALTAHNWQNLRFGLNILWALTKLYFNPCLQANFNLILVIYTLACDQSRPLGMEDKTIAGWQITASSNYNAYDPWRARLRDTRSWATATQNPSSPWIQVEFVNITIITGIQTQGEGLRLGWVETLHVAYEENSAWCYIMDGEKEMVCVSLSEQFLAVA